MKITGLPRHDPTDLPSATIITHLSRNMEQRNFGDGILDSARAKISIYTNDPAVKNSVYFGGTFQVYQGSIYIYM